MRGDFGAGSDPVDIFLEVNNTRLYLTG